MYAKARQEVETRRPRAVMGPMRDADALMISREDAALLKMSFRIGVLRSSFDHKLCFQ
jgi:hypothetical protein